jgi:23S rRNA (cytosine1962-C5)-methyltransferase
VSDFRNRLKKNSKHLFAWAEREGHSAFRLFDRDLPDVPLAIDWYGHAVHVAEYYSRKQREGQQSIRQAVADDIVNALSVEPSKIFFKSHQPHAWGETQYARLGEQATIVSVRESALNFECNLSDFLDTGLFLDHRQTRRRVRAQASNRRFLNLFGYTGSFSVYAAAGGAASTTTVDLSHSYCDWARRNLATNGFVDDTRHQVICDDVMSFLQRSTERYDLMVVDPPSFSASKKMSRRFEVQRDHVELIDACLKRMLPGGVLYFSTNFLPFQLSESLQWGTELTAMLKPKDFRHQLHRCWQFDPEAKRLLSKHR